MVNMRDENEVVRPHNVSSVAVDVVPFTLAIVA